MMFADRSLINVYYPKENKENNSYTVISSSMDTEMVCQIHKDKIGKDVVMSNHLNYVHLRECTLIKGPACQWTSITSHDLEGYAHQTLRQKVLESMLTKDENLINFILTKNKPTIPDKWIYYKDNL